MKPLKRVVVIGPECTGKSALSAFLADHFKTTWVPEYARAYLDTLGRPYTQEDLLTIAQGQISVEDQTAEKAESVLICDTNLYVIKIWSVFKYGNVAKEILDGIANRSYDLYLLTYIDIPWVADSQREHPDERQQLYDLYLNEMKNQRVPFVEIKGDRDTRRTTAIEAIKRIL